VIYRPIEECTLALGGGQVGLDVILEIGSNRIREHLSFPRIHARLRQRGVAIAPMTVQYQFRNYLSLIGSYAGRGDGRLMQQLREQGVILPVIDGIQFGPGEPVLYLIIDALSRKPLFGAEKICRGADDLVPFIAQLKELKVPILAVVCDKERGLVPAIEKALPGVRVQFCQLHFLKNVAKPMQEDLQALGAEVRQKEEDLRALERDLLRQRETEEGDPCLSEDHSVALQLCEAARAEARRYARDPFDPTALARHKGLQRVARTVGEARRKKGGLGQTSSVLVGS